MLWVLLKLFWKKSSQKVSERLKETLYVDAEMKSENLTAVLPFVSGQVQECNDPHSGVFGVGGGEGRNSSPVPNLILSFLPSTLAPAMSC